MSTPTFSETELSRIIEMAWEDRTPFEAIQWQFGLQEKDVIALMQRHMKPSSFKMWRKRVSGRATKHAKKRGFVLGPHKAAGQKIGWVFRHKGR